MWPEAPRTNRAYRWFCGLGLEDKVPHHSTFSVNRHGRFRESDILRKVFEEVVCGCMTAGLVGGEGFAVDASVNGTFQPVDGVVILARRQMTEAQIPHPDSLARIPWAESYTSFAVGEPFLGLAR